MGKTNTVETPSSDFKVITPEIPLLSQQEITSKRIPVSYINLQLNPYPNTQLDLFCSDNLSFQCTAPSAWLINCVYFNTQLNHQLEKNIGYKVLQFITRWRLRSSLVTKPYGAQTQQLLHKNDELRQILSPVTICLNKFCSTLVQLVNTLTTLKIILLYV